MHGVLLVNLGTPDAPTPRAVRRYLREFLGDPRVLDIPALGRWALLNLVILPFRPAKSAAAYQKIWGHSPARGSPLLAHGLDLAESVRRELGPTFRVELGMRYGAPSLSSAIERLVLDGAESLTVVPLYPQYASSSTGSSLERVYALTGEKWNARPLRVMPAFFDAPWFLDAFAEVARPVLAGCSPEHVLMSFHGLPERQVKKSDETGTHCFGSAGCCDAVGEKNRFCYRAQCFATARGLAQRLGLGPEGFTVGFQSRLGRTPWVKPYTDELLVSLAKQGVKRLAVMCPAFVADCLETLEEIGIRANESFRAAGGESVTLVPSLNAHPAWVKGLSGAVRALTPIGP
jgi:ferrochelatase